MNIPELTDELLTANIRVVEVVVLCPHCETWIGGWGGDPRGSSNVCGQCGGLYHVQCEADVKFC
jgi:hypothetical protein